MVGRVEVCIASLRVVSVVAATVVAVVGVVVADIDVAPSLL